MSKIYCLKLIVWELIISVFWKFFISYNLGHFPKVEPVSLVYDHICTYTCASAHIYIHMYIYKYICAYIMANNLITQYVMF